MALTSFRRIFGSGPFIHASSLMLFLLIHLANRALNLPRIPVPSPLNYWIAAGIMLLGFILVLWLGLWAYHSLGRSLITYGPYRYVRHPIYAVILSLEWIFAFFLFRSYFVLPACFISYFLAHQWIRYEERLLKREFGTAWETYAAAVGRFFPRRIAKRRSSYGL